MRLLFVKPSLAWPRTNGHDVYCYHMMKALAEEGATISLATSAVMDPRAVDGFTLDSYDHLAAVTLPSAPPPLRLTRSQERFRSFWGVDPAHIQAVRVLAEARRADVVIAFSLPALPFLGGVDRALRVWAMADEWVYHHLSQVQIADRSTWHHVKWALIKGAYERAYASLVDRIWAVSETDLRAARWLAGMKTGDLLPNGVDTEFFSPRPETVAPNSAVFWGRLDFEPNIDALLWFAKHVWPAVLARVPTARFTIIGYAPVPAVQRLAELPNVTLRPNVEDLRGAVCQHALVVLPMISGGGIKNKLLEGAAMARPIVATPRACLDLKSDGALPVALARQPGEFADEMVRLWNDPAAREQLGARARAWVTAFYSWGAPARDAYRAFASALAARAKSAS
jgi:glycosyltransferase involved in cell wall biosynthesis